MQDAAGSSSNSLSISNSSAEKNLEETRTIIPPGCSSGKRDSSQIVIIDKEQEPPSKKQLTFDEGVMASNSLTLFAPPSNTMVGHEEITRALPSAVYSAIDDFSSFGDYFIAGADGEIQSLPFPVQTVPNVEIVGNHSLPHVTTNVRPLPLNQGT
jgi:hypothetical protein